VLAESTSTIRLRRYDQPANFTRFGYDFLTIGLLLDSLNRDSI